MFHDGSFGLKVANSRIYKFHSFLLKKIIKLTDLGSTNSISYKLIKKYSKVHFYHFYILFGRIFNYFKNKHEYVQL